MYTLIRMALTLVAPIVMGILIGIIDIAFMIGDLSGDAKSTIAHGISAMIYLIALSFAAFNIDFIVNLGLPGFLSNQIVMLVLLGIIATIVVHTKSAVFKGGRGRGTHEKWAHSLVIGILVAVSPYLWTFVAPFIPFA